MLGLVVGAFVTSALAQAAPAAGAARPGIVGGSRATGEVAASLVLVVDEGPRGEVQECTGTVVAPRLVLTAGHCLVSTTSAARPAASSFLVANGRASAHIHRSRVVRAVTDPKYNEDSFEDDVGLLVLARRFDAPTLDLESPSASAEFASPGAHRVIAGWGERRPGQLFQQRWPFQAAVQIESSEVCALDATDDLALPFAPQSELCTLGSARGACHGDSGGPLLARSAGHLVEVAVISHGDGDCATSVPTFFTRASAAERWVASWIARLRARARRR